MVAHNPWRNNTLLYPSWRDPVAFRKVEPGVEAMVVSTCDPPSWLDDEARIEFERLTSGSDLDEVERANLAAYAFALTCWRRARDVVEQVHDSSVQTWVAPDGQERPHPAYMVESRLAAELAELAEAVGVNPPTRRRLTPTRIWFLDEGH